MSLIKLIKLGEQNSDDLFLELNSKLSDISKHLLFASGYYKYKNIEESEKNILLKVSEMFTVSVRLLFSAINNKNKNNVEKLILKSISKETNVSIKSFEELIQKYTFSQSYNNMIMLNINRYLGDIARLLQIKNGYIQGTFLEKDFILKNGMLMLYIIALYNILIIDGIDMQTRIETFTNLLN